MVKKDQAGIFELLSRLPAHVSALVRVEYENAKREIGRQLKKLGWGALLVVVALFILFFSLGAFVTAAIAGIAVALPVWAAALIVAFALLLLAGGLVWWGVNRIQNGNPVPEETLGRIEHDFERVAERMTLDEDDF